MATLALLILQIVAVALAHVQVTRAQRTYLRADGNSANTYALLNSVLGGTAYEVPDCGHAGAHITQHTDTTLNIPVFNFAAHANGASGATDSDTCSLYDRQRTEIKTYGPSPSHMKCALGESVSYSWDMRLNSQFQPSKSFTHVFQIKGKDGDDGTPLITITPRLKSDGVKVLQLLHAGANSSQVAIWEDTLSKYAGRWVHITVEYVCKLGGSINVRIKETQTGTALMNYSNPRLDMWRTGNSFTRPKWGIYRSLTDVGNLHDEHVYFNNFCIAKGSPLCN